MKKVFMTLAAVLCCANIALGQNAQEDRNRKYNITLGNVEYAHHNEKLSAGEAVGEILTGVLTGQTSVEASKYEDDVKSAIIKGLSSAYRFTFNDALLRLDDVVEEGNLVVDALITNINAKSSSHTWKDKKGDVQVSTTYTGITEAVLTVKDAKTGKVLANPTVKGQGIGSSSYSTSDKAIREAIERLSGQVTSWLNRYRPLQANIIEGAAAKKNKQKEVYIDMGSSEGAFEGLHMIVYQIKTIGGKQARTEIGKLKIEAIEGDDISRCKVQGGGKEIKAALDSGEQLIVLSRN